MRFHQLAMAVPALLAGTSAFAQEVPTTASAEKAPASTPVEGEIIVTATRRPENVQRVPLSVDVISPQDLSRNNLTAASDLPRLAPSVQFTNAGQANLQGFSVRGVSTYAFADTLEQTVGVNIDGVPVGRPAGSLTSLVDLERVEVLQGPQGLLFGKNASAGLIAVYTAKPKFENSLSGHFTYASRDEVNVDAASNLELVPDTLALRLTGWSFRRDGFIRSVPLDKMVSGRSEQGLRGRLRWKPTANLEANLTAEYAHGDSDCCAYVSISYPAGSPFAAADAALGITPGFDNFRSGTPQKPGVPENQYARYNNYNYALELTYDLGGATLTSLTGYRRNRENDRYDGTIANLPINDSTYYDGHYRQVTQEVRLTGDAGNLRYVLGGFFYNLKLSSMQEQGACLPVGTPCTFLARDVYVTLDSNSYAAFGEATLSLTPSLRVSAGGRLSHDTVDGTFNRVVPAGAGVLTPPYTSAASTDYTNLSGRFGLQYDVDPTKMLYATLASGYKGPGLGYSTDFSSAIFASTGGIVKPETTRSAEIGFKTRWPHANLTFNIAGFYSTFKNFQSTVGLPNTVPIAFAIVNANQIRTQGGQVEATWRPVSGFELTANIAYTDAKFTDFANAPCYREQTAATGCTGGVYNLNGKSLTDAPKWKYTLGGRYETAIGDWKTSYQVDFLYKSSVYWLAGNPYSKNDGYGLLNMSLGITPPESQLQLMFFVRNLLNEHDFGRITPNPFANGYVAPRTYDTQRSFGATLSFDF